MIISKNFHWNKTVVNTFPALPIKSPLGSVGRLLSLTSFPQTLLSIQPSKTMSPTSKPVAKRGRRAFNPPRPATKTTKAKPTIPRRKSAPAKQSFIDSAAEDDEDEADDDDDAELISSRSKNASASEESDSLPTTTRVGTQDAPPTIPPALLTKLLHHHFRDDKIRIEKEANGVVGKYMETFVREAIARAAFERSEAGGEGIGGHFLEVCGSTSW